MAINQGSWLPTILVHQQSWWSVKALRLFTLYIYSGVTFALGTFLGAFPGLLFLGLFQPGFVVVTRFPGGNRRPPGIDPASSPRVRPGSPEGGGMSWTPAVGFEVFGALVGSRGPAGYSPGQVALSRLWARRRDPEGAPQRRRCSGDPRSLTRGPALKKGKSRWTCGPNGSL